MSKGLKIMSLGVINHDMSLSVQTNFAKTMFVQADSSCYLSLEAVCCSACDLILLVFFLWKQFVVVPVT
jgi:hypothetical protein